MKKDTSQPKSVSKKQSDVGEGEEATSDIVIQLADLSEWSIFKGKLAEQLPVELAAMPRNNETWLVEGMKCRIAIALREASLSKETKLFDLKLLRCTNPSVVKSKPDFKAGELALVPASQKQ